MSQTCHACHQACPDGYVCHACTGKARKHLESLAYLLEFIDEKRARYGSNFKRNPGSRPAETPVPFDPRVSTVADPIINGLSGSVKVVLEGCGYHLDPGRMEPHTAATWLADQLDWLRLVPEGAEEMRFYRDADRRLERLFDHIERVFLGPCKARVVTEEEGEHRCDEIIYAEPDPTAGLPPFTACRRCGANVDVKSRRAEFRAAVKIYQATMRELVNFAPMLLEETVSEWKLREVARRGYLRPVGARKVLNLRQELREVRTYRMGDVEMALRRYDREREERKAG